MADVKFRVHLTNNPNESLRPGQTIVGTVLVDTATDCDAHGIFIKFDGWAEVHWTEERTVYNSHYGYHHGSYDHHTHYRTVTEHYTAHEQYFMNTVYLLGNGSSSHKIPAGTHSYPFQFTIPWNIPSSFDGDNGKVSYEIQSVLQLANGNGYEAKVPFLVTGILDLNTYPETNYPINLAQSKTMCCCCCESGPVGYTLKMRKKGFLPGGFIQFEAELSNKSNCNVYATTIELIQTVTYHSTRGHSTSNEHFICSTEGPAVERGETKYWEGNIMKIPSLPITKLGCCKIIDVQYRIKFEMKIDGYTSNFEETISIVLGSVPFRDHEHSHHHQHRKSTSASKRRKKSKKTL